MQKSIDPTTVYNTEEAAELVGVDRRSIYNEIRAGNLKAKQFGKGFKLLGENLLAFMGSATYGEAEQSNKLPDSER